ncbi:thrombopoietin-like [Xiphias gladius]|uniref:thrombopoietin-like n=1 Tax=Xiphias gladius TaxID=8245 RepID=UPI001A994DC0|nr:thrombopoietin-like [Xiphias gladius]
MEEGGRLKDHSWGTSCTQERVMAYSRLLVLLIGVISSHLPEVQGRPTDFWCNDQARESMEKRIEGVKKDMAGCVGSDVLPSPVQLPCVWVHLAEWKNKTLQHKLAEVVGALRAFQDEVQGAIKNTTLQCQTSLLDTMAQHIRNYVAIVNTLQIQNDTEEPSHSVVQYCSSQTSLMKVLEQYRKLLKGKLGDLATDLHRKICKEERRTANTKGP